MRKVLTLVLLSSISLSGATWADSHSEKEGKHHKRASPEKKVERMTEKLSLTQEQADAILKIMQARHEQAEDIRAQMKAQNMAAQGEIKQLLNAEQQAKYSKMHKNKKQHDGKKRPDCDDD